MRRLFSHPSPYPPPQAGRSPAHAWVWGVLILAGLGLRLVFMDISLERLPVSSDEAMVVLQAKQIARGERPLLFLAQPYQFPLGAYLQAPLVDQLPRDAWGARGPGFVLGLISFLGLCLAIRGLAPPGAAWPALLLAVFPSVYLLMFQAGYLVPQYDYMLALWSLAAPLALSLAGDQPRRAWGRCVLLGLIGGLALSVHLLALSLLAPLLLAVCLAAGARRLPGRGLALGLGLAMGLLPLLAARMLYPKASQLMDATLAWSQAFSLGRLQALVGAMAGALGALTCTFPDFDQILEPWPWLAPILPGVFLALLAAAGLAGLWRLGRRPRSDGFAQAAPRLAAAPGLALACAPWLGMLMFLLAERANSAQFRYLLILPWVLPLLLAQLLALAGPWTRRGLGLLAVMLAAFNLFMGVQLMQTWRQPGFAAKHAEMPDLAPALAYLRSQEITRCFASYWSAYRIGFLTDEAVIASQPLNERFPSWPTPYRDQVVGDPRAAYVLTSPDALDYQRFEAALAQAGVLCQRRETGAYRIYHQFRDPRQEGERRIAPDRLRISASHAKERAERLGDGDPHSKWASGVGQAKGMWLEVSLDAPANLSRLVIHYGDYPHDQAPALDLYYRREGEWLPLLLDVPASLDPFGLLAQVPVFGDKLRTLRFAPVQADGLRLELDTPHAGRQWTLGELELYEREVPPAPPPAEPAPASAGQGQP